MKMFSITFALAFSERKPQDIFHSAILKRSLNCVEYDR